MATCDTEKTDKICYYYNTPSGCWRRDRCNFQHIRDETAEYRPVCKFYGTPKKCWYGKDCYFRHVKPNPNSKSPTKKSNKNEQEEKEGKSDESEISDDEMSKNKLYADEKDSDPDGNKELSRTYIKSTTLRSDITCGECGQIFKDGAGGVGAYTAIEKHYFTMLGRADQKHMKIFHTDDRFVHEQAQCGACGQIFRHPEDLMRHLASKYAAKQEKHNHKEFFWEIVHQFVVRDMDPEVQSRSMILDYLSVLI